jgi:anti-sigma factor RsiW
MEDGGVGHEVSHDDLMRYLDDELPAARRDEVALHLERCTECRREFIVFQRMKGDLLAMARENHVGPSLWDGISRRLARPVGWLFLAGGGIALAGWGIWSYVTSPEVFWRKLAVGAVVVGAALLLLSAIIDRVRALASDPYREIQR